MNFAINLLGVCGFSTVPVCILTINIFSVGVDSQVSLPRRIHPGGGDGYRVKHSTRALGFSSSVTPG